MFFVFIHRLHLLTDCLYWKVVWTERLYYWKVASVHRLFVFTGIHYSKFTSIKRMHRLRGCLKWQVVWLDKSSTIERLLNLFVKFLVFWKVFWEAVVEGFRNQNKSFLYWKGCVIARLCDCEVVWLGGCLIARLHDCKVAWLRGCWLRSCVNARLRECEGAWLQGCVIERFYDWEVAWCRLGEVHQRECSYLARLSDLPMVRNFSKDLLVLTPASGQMFSMF